MTDKLLKGYPLDPEYIHALVNGFRQIKYVPESSVAIYLQYTWDLNEASIKFGNESSEAELIRDDLEKKVDFYALNPDERKLVENFSAALNWQEDNKGN